MYHATARHFASSSLNKELTEHTEPKQQKQQQAKRPNPIVLSNS